MNEVIRAAAELQAVCQSLGWQFCFIGGLDQLELRREEFEQELKPPFDLQTENMLT